MQQLFSTGQRQVTDSFAAGADGVTLNYTVAVPLFEENGEKISGCLFCAIYFDEVTEILQQSASANRAEATLIGSRGQIMSSTAGLPYGDPVMDVLRNARLFGTTADRLEEQMLARMPGDYWSLHRMGYSFIRQLRNGFCGEPAEFITGAVPGHLFVHRTDASDPEVYRRPDEGSRRPGPFCGRARKENLS